ncbi:MAG: 2-succinyl-5-enolpyruvyl-6-hydroxy-3-cyclohexene-1-carboxylic-acid synthase [Clostridia bacterium]|nr:2-succinyl-5-enolpyruvyl-6-hydroxy-3-cyclohexene-1-carboxylic-acid synthase [Clostridia bacterium]
MYSNYRSVQILISLLKEYQIQDIILSPGGSDIPLIHSIETDSYFNCYSVVDERSAAYYAMGMAQVKNRAVACVCTSGSAVCNYLPGITEAFYQNVPVLAITADKNPYYQGQLEIQKIDQTNVFNGVIKKSVDLPIGNSEDDEWLCNRLVNEAMLALTHHGKGPAHINIPIVGDYNNYDCEKLPVERKISINSLADGNTMWKTMAERLIMAKRVLVVVGQNVVFTRQDIANMNLFFEKINCVYGIEHLSNLVCNGTVNTYLITEMVGTNAMKRLMPNIVISLGNNLSAYNLKPVLRSNYKNLENWLVSEGGQVRDAYKCLNEIFECSASTFFEKIVENLSEAQETTHEYLALWKNELSKIKDKEYEFSNFYVAQKLAKVIPENSVLHTAILNSTRIMQFFDLSKGVQTYSNVGTLGIDGCFSTFAGSAAATDELAFLLIGDLSFFYDMNAAGLRSISSNVRIVLLNNGGGSEFHFFMGREKIPTIDSYICAEHGKTAEGWIRSLGYDYYSATNKVELDAIIEKFGQKSDKPMFLEVFTEMEHDADLTREYYKENKEVTTQSGIKKAIKSIVPDKQIKKAKRIIDIIKS